MQRILIKDLKEYIGKEITIKGWVDVRRDQGKMIFFDFRDRTGFVQGVVLSGSPAKEVAERARPEWVVEVRGKVNARPERNVQKEKLNGAIELEILEINVLSQSAELPFGRDVELNLDTYLDNLPLTLRTEKNKAVFKVQAEIAKSYREFLGSQNFTEFQ